MLKLQGIEAVFFSALKAAEELEDIEEGREENESNENQLEEEEKDASDDNSDDYEVFVLFRGDNFCVPSYVTYGRWSLWRYSLLMMIFCKLMRGLIMYPGCYERSGNRIHLGS